MVNACDKIGKRLDNAGPSAIIWNLYEEPMPKRCWQRDLKSDCYEQIPQSKEKETAEQSTSQDRGELQMVEMRSGKVYMRKE